MTDEEKTEYFIELYMASLRAFYDNPHLKEPNKKSERYAQLDQARKLIDLMEGEYCDFIHLQFQAFKKLKIAPKPHHLISEAALKRYTAHQEKYNIHSTEVYATNEDWLTVKKTWRGYPISQILLPVAQDTIAMHAYSLSPAKPGESVSRTEEDRDAVFYLEAKLKYKGVAITETIKKLLEEMK